MNFLIGIVKLLFGASGLFVHVGWFYSWSSSLAKGLIALGVRQPLGRLFSHYMSGQFVSNFLPTTVGGDVVRVSRLTKDTDDGPISFTSVVFERLSGGWFTGDNVYWIRYKPRLNWLGQLN